jgi:hypothetical protein
MTQTDHVTQANSAHTEQLSATAQSLSEQAAHLMQLVSTFTLSGGQKNPLNRHAFPRRESDPVHSVGSNLVQAAKTNRRRPVSRTPLAQPSSKTPRLPAKV